MSSLQLVLINLTDYYQALLYFAIIDKKLHLRKSWMSGGVDTVVRLQQFITKLSIIKYIVRFQLLECEYFVLLLCF